MDQTALALADLAFVSTPGPNSTKVRAAIHAYEWVAHHPDPFFSPSFEDWAKFARIEGIVQ